MIQPFELFRRAQSLGLSVEVDGDSLLVKPLSKCPAELVNELRKHKATLLQWLSEPRCPGWGVVPPETLPLNPSKPEPTPEDRECVIAYLLRQGCDRPSPLTRWLVERENAYYDGPGKSWDCAIICYAVARDALCWQLNRSEREAIELIESLQD